MVYHCYLKLRPDVARRPLSLDIIRQRRRIANKRVMPKQSVSNFEGYRESDITYYVDPANGDFSLVRGVKISGKFAEVESLHPELAAQVAAEAGNVRSADRAYQLSRCHVIECDHIVGEGQILVTMRWLDHGAWQCDGRPSRDRVLLRNTLAKATVPEPAAVAQVAEQPEPAAVFDLDPVIIAADQLAAPPGRFDPFRSPVANNPQQPCGDALA